MIVRIVPIAPVVSKYFETIRTTGAIGSFHMIVSIASKARDAGSSAMSLGQTIEFLRVFWLQNLHDRPDRTQLYPSDRGRLSRPGRLRSSG